MICMCGVVVDDARHAQAEELVVGVARRRSPNRRPVELDPPGGLQRLDRGGQVIEVEFVEGVGGALPCGRS